MNTVRSPRPQRGALLLTVIVVTGLTALTGGLAIRVVMQNQSETNRVYDDIIHDRPVSEERLERARTNTLTNLRVVKGAADLIVAVDPNPDAGSVVSAYGGGVIGNYADSASNPDRPTRSNPLPPGVPEPGPSCDSAHHSLCTSYASCARAGGSWSEGRCNRVTASCDSSHLDLCTGPNQCAQAGGFWHDNNCFATPQELCEPQSLEHCDSASDCSGAGGFWYDSACNSEPQALCNADDLSLCTSSSECVAAGGHWYDHQCNASPEACYVDVTQCALRSDCANAGGFWYSDRCNAEEEACNGSNPQLCTDAGSCESAGGYWYSNACNTTPDMYTCDGGSTILRSLVCNGTQNCPLGDDEANCGTQSSCCVATNGCPSETATSCGATCCCCPYGYACDQVNPANGCVPSL